MFLVAGYGWYDSLSRRKWKLINEDYTYWGMSFMTLYFTIDFLSEFLRDNQILLATTKILFEVIFITEIAITIGYWVLLYRGTLNDLITNFNFWNNHVYPLTLLFIDVFLNNIKWNWKNNWIFVIFSELTYLINYCF